MSKIGKKIIKGLKEFNEALKNGDDLTKKFRCTTLRRKKDGKIEVIKHGTSRTG